MNCAEAPLIELLESELGEAETEELLAHLDSCEECRQRLQVMAALCASRPEKARVFARPRFWLLAASLLLAIFLPVLYFSRPSPSVESLAIGGSYPYFPLQTREGTAAAEGEGRRQAYASYARGEYENAERLLNALPPEAETTFYIGVSQYLQGKYPAALASLQKSAADPRWKNPSLWYKGSALLRLKRTEEAKRVLDEVAKTGGEFSREATQLLERVRKADGKE